LKFSLKYANIEAEIPAELKAEKGTDREEVKSLTELSDDQLSQLYES